MLVDKFLPHQHSLPDRSSLALTCMTAVRVVLGSNRAVGSCVYRKNHCDLQSWARAVCTFPAVPRSTQPSTLRGTVNEYQLSAWVIIINGDGGCRGYLPKTGGLTAQVRWLGLRVIGRLALFYIHQMNRLNCRNDLDHDDSTINIVVVIIISTFTNYFTFNNVINSRNNRTRENLHRASVSRNLRKEVLNTKPEKNGNKCQLKF